ncbi:MAG: metal-dependent hydrolase [Candidatus Nanohaloarchaea archaeon]
MGDFSEHVFFGFLSAAVVAYFLKELLVVGSLELVAASVALFVGSVLPDIDNKNAYVHRAVKAFVSIASGAAVMVLLPASIQSRFVTASVVVLSVYTIISSVKIKHRGFTHTVSFCLTLTALTAVAGLYFFQSATPGIAFGIGLGSHLLLDREFRLA